MPRISASLVKVTLVSLAISIAAVAVVSAYFRRRRRSAKAPAKALRAWVDVPAEEEMGDVLDTSKKSSVSDGRRSPYVASAKSGGTSRDVASLSASVTPRGQPCIEGTAARSTVSASDGASSLSSTMTLGAVDDEDPAACTPEQMCHLGMEKLRKARSLWEEALARLQAESIAMNPLEPQLRTLVRQVQLLETLYESELEQEVSMAAYEGSRDASLSSSSTMAAALLEMNRQYELQQDSRQQLYRENGRSRDDSISNESSQDSFVSALEVPDLSDLDVQMHAVAVQGTGDGAASRQVLYEAALLEVQHGSVPYRKLRTAVVGCSSDAEFLARLHALRIGLNETLTNDANRKWFLDTGKCIVGMMLEKADKDPQDFDTALDGIVEFFQDPENWEIAKEELSGRNVKCYTFYDIVLDFIFMDAFDDLLNPPASVTSVTLNRWLSNGLKETALATAVWSVLKAKRRMLKFPRGFIAQFYSLSEHVSPVLAWGFLGPDSELKEMCYAFKDQLIGFISDLFNCKKVRYTGVEEMAHDIMSVAQQRAAVLTSVLHNGDVALPQ